MPHVNDLIKHTNGNSYKVIEEVSIVDRNYQSNNCLLYVSLSDGAQYIRERTGFDKFELIGKTNIYAEPNPLKAKYKLINIWVDACREATAKPFIVLYTDDLLDKERAVKGVLGEFDLLDITNTDDTYDIESQILAHQMHDKITCTELSSLIFKTFSYFFHVSLIPKDDSEVYLNMAELIFKVIEFQEPMQY